MVRNIPKTKEDCLNQGKAILNMMLQSSKMLPIGEDLGIVPDYVKEDIIDFNLLCFSSSSIEGIQR